MAASSKSKPKSKKTAKVTKAPKKKASASSSKGSTKAATKKASKKASSKKSASAPSKAKATKATKATKAAKSKKTAGVKSLGASKGPSKKKKKTAAAQNRRSKANAALEAALAETEASSTEEEEEFDPEAFFAASGVENFRPHVMRKERVDLAVTVRYRFMKGPLVYNAELINLSKGGLALRTPEIIKDGTELRIEIPLPHTSELFAIQAEVVWSSEMEGQENEEGKPVIHTGLRFKPMSLAKQAVINQFIQQRRDEVIMAKIGLDKFTDSVPVAGLD